MSCHPPDARTDVFLHRAITPKLFLHVWVGSRLYSFADPNQREQMDRNTKIANGIYVVGGTALGAFTSWYLYRVRLIIAPCSH